MKRNCISILLIILCLQGTLSAQKKKYPTLWMGFFSAGYAISKPGDLENYYNYVLENFRYNGIPIQNQVKFGRTLVVNGGFMITRLKNIWFGIAGGYWFSPAYSNYKDYGGTLKVNCTVNSYEFDLKGLATLFKMGDLPFNISIQPGVSYTTAKITSDLNYFNHTSGNLSGSWYAWAWGPTCQITVGSVIPFFGYGIVLEAGYRLSWNNVDFNSMKFEGDIPKKMMTSGIGQNGFVFLLSVRKQF